MELRKIHGDHGACRGCAERGAWNGADPKSVRFFCAEDDNLSGHSECHFLAVLLQG